MTRSKTGSRAHPEEGPRWLKRQSLPDEALICGSAPTLLEEFNLARARMPGALVAAVNESARVIHADILFTQHPERALWFRDRSRAPGLEVHTAKPLQRAAQPGIDVYWPDCITLATSGGSAIAIALKMGFQRIILCGMPMNGGDGYFRGASMRADEPRFGMESPDSTYIQGYRNKLVEFTQKEPESLDIVRSMGGFTQELFGAPDWADAMHENRKVDS